MYFNASSDEFYHARYFKHHPQLDNATANAGYGLAFRYAAVSELTKQEAAIATNGEIKSAMRTIETTFPLHWEAKAYVTLSEGSLWQIKSVGVAAQKNVQAARYAMPRRKYTLVLVEVEDPLGLKV